LIAFRRLTKFHAKKTKEQRRQDVFFFFAPLREISDALINIRFQLNTIQTMNNPSQICSLPLKTITVIVIFLLAAGIMHAAFRDKSAVTNSNQMML